MPKIYILTAYDDHLSPGIDCSIEPSMTKQSFKEECDINNIMARFKTTGVLEFVNEFEPRYMDASSVQFQDAMNIVADANSMFSSMPAHLRSRFDNDPAKFLAFIDDPKMVQESIDLGLRIAPIVDDGASEASVSPKPSATLPSSSDSPVPS